MKVKQIKGNFEISEQKSLVKDLQNSFFITKSEIKAANLDLELALNAKKPDATYLL
jgi:hypothetical protein